MRRAIGGTALLLACTAMQPGLAGTTPRHPAARSPAPIVTMVNHQMPAWGRIALSLHDVAAPEVRTVDGGIELLFAKGTRVLLPTGHSLNQVSGIGLRETPDGPVASIRFACTCAATPHHLDGLLRLDIKEAAKPASTAAKPAPTDARPAAPAAKPPPVAAKPAARPAPSKEATELDKLREALTAKLAVLNGGRPPPPATATAGSDKTAAAANAQPAAPPVCPPRFDPSGWTRKGNFVARLKELRAQIATSHESPAAMADLADFYLLHALAGEAVAITGEAQTGELRPEDRDRLAATGGIARLLQREPLDPASPLLAIAADCAAPDAGLWRALAAASIGDAEGVARNAEAAATALRQVPEPLLQLIAFRIADAAGDNPAPLRVMAGALRNADTSLPENEAGRFLLQARIARLTGDAEDERAFLERAARYDRTVPGLTAKARLTALRIAGDLPQNDRNEAVLADIARTYRSETVGQEAAEQYAEHRLRLGDHASALAIADETAGPASSRTRDSRGAALAARIQRILMVDPPTATPLPDPAERLALYWRYEGYATPGTKGDDIRIGAARIMLAQAMPEPAVELLRQLSDASAATDAARLLRATAEARAGDANVALAMVRGMAVGDEQRRIARLALARLGQFADAAQQLDRMTGAADLSQRAALLFQGKSWDAAANAYAALLADAELPGEARDDAAQRYAVALALSGGAASQGLPKLPEPATHLLAVLPSPPSATPAETTPATTLPVARDRARAIETLLGPPPTAQQGS